MRAWVLSDLHQEFRRTEYASHPLTRFEPEPPADGFDVLVLAGDIDVPLTKSLQWAADRFAGEDVIYVPGNHDYFVGDGPDGAYTMVEQMEAGHELADRLGIHLLMDDTTIIAGARFVGTTLWSDFVSVGRGNPAAKIAEAAGRNGMNDYRKIKRWSTAHPDKRKRLRPQDTIAAHRASRAYIEGVLALPFDGPTVVVTHHAPHPDSLDDKHRGSLDWCYASNLSGIMTGSTAPDLWVHGHIHQAVDYEVGATRIVANPRGYQFVEAEKNNGFDPELVLEIGGYEARPPGP